MTIEEIEKWVENGNKHYDQIKMLVREPNAYTRIKFLLSRIKELEEGIEKDISDNRYLNPFKPKEYIQFLLSRIEELKQEKNDLAGICASTIRKRKELEEGIEEHYDLNHIACLESDGTYSMVECKGLKKLYKLIQKGGD